jgi:hypothetical protein
MLCKNFPWKVSGGNKTLLIAGTPLEPLKLQRKDEKPKRECLKIKWIGQSAAKSRTEKRSTTRETFMGVS